MKLTSLLALILLVITITAARAADAEVKDLSIDGGVQDGKARLVIEAHLKGTPGSEQNLLFATALQHTMRFSREQIAHTITLNIDILQGEPRELPFTLTGEGEITNVTGEALLDWSIRQQTNGTRTLVLRTRKSDKPITNLTATITAQHEVRSWPSAAIRPLALVPPQAALFSGFVKIESAPELSVEPASPSGVVPIEATLLPPPMRSETKDDETQPLAFRVHGSAYNIPLQVRFADPEARRVVLRDFKLVGRLGDSKASFTLTATARVKNPTGASLALLSGGAAFTDLPSQTDWRLRVNQPTGAPPTFVLVFDRAGEFPIRLQFDAAVRQSNGWNQIDFRVAPSALQPVVFEGLAADTQIEFAGGAKPERSGNNFVSFLPPSGTVKLSWKESPPEAEGKLFYSANMLSQIAISPGLMRQISILDFKVMQGELNRVVVVIRRPANNVPAVTRVAGPNILRWQLEPAANAQEQRLVVEFNQPQKDAFALQLHMQTELGAFPQPVDAIQLRPEGAIRFGGHFRVVNEGAVRLEVTQATGLSQISPEQFPESDLTKALFGATGNQRFVFRFSSADFGLRIQADNILPELSVSEVIAYHLGETELAIDVEFEIDIREAPVRELLLRVPRTYTVARLNAAGLSDYFTTDNPEEPNAQLRLVYAQPISGRQVVQLRLEHNGALGEAVWTLPRVEVTNAKSTRGHIGISADAGFRLTPERTQGVTDIATAFFPKKLNGIQAAFRLSDAGWQIAMRVERLPQSIQADVFHLFSIAEGVGYGSSTMNYLISGAPVSVFNVELSSEYFNVEFTGKDIRNWQKTATGYTVQLHTPVSGAYTLLATYERPFKSQGDTLTFTGARPVDAQSEQGHTVIVSAYQFQVTPVNVSTGLMPLETAEVPAEYRLFFDAPILAAYRYTSRPFNLQLGLTPLAQGETLSIVVDRAALNTRISKDGEVLTDVRYFLKNRGNPYLRLALPVGTVLWSITVNGSTVVPVKDGSANLVPLPQRSDPNAIQVLDLKLATRSTTPKRVTVAAPGVDAPILLADWKFDPDTGQRLVFRRGSLAPEEGGAADASGFAGLVRLFSGYSSQRALGQLTIGLALVVLAIWAWRWASGNGTYRFTARHLAGTIVGLIAILIAAATFATLIDLANSERHSIPRNLAFLAPIQQSGSALSVEVANIPDRFSFWRVMASAWPALFAVAVWGYAFLTSRQWLRPFGVVLGWTLLAWTALRSPNGAAAFFFIVLAFLLLMFVVPALRRLWQLPRRPVPPTEPSAAPAVAVLLLGGLLGLMATGATVSAATSPPPRSVNRDTPIAQSVVQEITVKDNFASGTTKVLWQASKGQLLPLLYEPAILTRISYPTNAVQFVQTPAGGKRAWQLLAQQDGAIATDFTFQLHASRKGDESGFVLPTQQGLVNRLTLTLKDLDVDVVAPQAVSIEREMVGSNTVATLVLPPVSDVWIGWKPRTRDVKSEKPVFYAELIQLYVPSAGVIEGLHQVQVRPSRGELNELFLDIPAGATITDVTDPSSASTVSVWRFDPDTRKLRVTLSPAQSRPFAIVVRSQLAAGSLPYEQTIGLLSVTNAEGQLGLVGIATGNEVQLDSVTADDFTPINLEDFPQPVLQPLAAQIAGLTLRRAFRYTDPQAAITLKASAVQPDVRVETQETLSLGEDRVLLAINLNAEITRAGIFRLSFVLPAGLDVESVSGNALSHWTELKTEEGRIITMHLKGKTEGQQQFAISLSGPGVKATQGWSVPRFALREASKQRGQLLIVPEQGFRLQIRTREGLTQLDPQKSTGLPPAYRQKGVLAFRLLHAQWQLSVDIEQVDAWVQVTGLQHVNVSDAQVKVAANLQYQIENTGLKALRVRVPANAESVRFRGEQVADFLPVPNLVADGLQTWEVKLHRRIIGSYMLHVSWLVSLPQQVTTHMVQGVQAVDVNLQRGFLTIQSGGRVQVRVGTLPASLQLAEWQSIPRTLQQDIAAASADYTYRLVNAAYQLPLTLERHEATKLLPARVTSVTLSSVISDEGVMLTEARLELIPGDKRLLQVSLPTNAQFWFAFVNKNGVWPWREQDRLLVPLEQQSRVDKPLLVELFYSSRISSPATRSLDATLLGPKFDLPLENITWQIYLDDKWHLADWTGSLQLQEDTLIGRGPAQDLQTYLQTEANFKREKTKEAEEMLSMGNTLLERGDPHRARRAFKAAYGLSTHDDAFNEDARVQLHNLKLQQALIGLNVRQSVVAGETDEQKLRGHKDINYTQQQAKQIIDAASADDNAALMRLAERLIQQQDAAVSSPTAIRASIPKQGRLLTFRRTVQVDNWADLRIGLEATALRTASWTLKAVILVATFLFLAILLWATKQLRRAEAAA